MTIMSLLNHSLANLQRKLVSMAQQKASLPQGGKLRLLNHLVAARLQEAELLVVGYLQRTENAAASDPGRQINGWRFHR